MVLRGRLGANWSWKVHLEAQARIICHESVRPSTITHHHMPVLSRHSLSTCKSPSMQASNTSSQFDPSIRHPKNALLPIPQYESITHEKHSKSILPHMSHYLPPENDEGHTEYKLKLVSIDKRRLKHLTTQLKYRIMEGAGEAIYELGVTDHGYPVGLCAEELSESLRNINTMANRLGAEVLLLAERRIHSPDPFQHTNCLPKTPHSSHSATRRVLELLVKQPALKSYLEFNSIYVAACFCDTDHHEHDSPLQSAFSSDPQKDTPTSSDNDLSEDFFEDELQSMADDFASSLNLTEDDPLYCEDVST